MPIAVPLIAAGIGAAGTLYAGSQANKAAKQQQQAYQTANDQNLALQREALAQSQQNNQPFMQAGYGALSQLAQQFGLGGATPTSSGGGATSSGYDVNAYIAQNPDVAAARQDLERQGVLGPGKQWNTFEEWVAEVQLPGAMAAGEQRAYPTVQQQQTPQGQQQLGVGQDYGPQYSERTDYGSGPAMPDLSVEAYRESPGFQNRLKQAGRATNAQFAARGILNSGAAAEEFGKRMQNIADEDYNNWVSQQMSLYDRSRQNFVQDRQYGTGVYDADRNYLTNRFDTNVNDLFRLTGIGQNAANNNSSAQSNFASNAGNQNNTFANNLSNVYGNQAANNATMWNNLAGIGQSLVTNWGSGGNTLGSYTPFTPQDSGGVYTPITPFTPQGMTFQGKSY